MVWWITTTLLIWAKSIEYNLHLSKHGHLNSQPQSWTCTSKASSSAHIFSIKIDTLKPWKVIEAQLHAKWVLTPTRKKINMTFIFQAFWVFGAFHTMHFALASSIEYWKSAPTTAVSTTSNGVPLVAALPTLLQLSSLPPDWEQFWCMICWCFCRWRMMADWQSRLVLGGRMCYCVIFSLLHTFTASKCKFLLIKIPQMFYDQVRQKPKISVG